MTFVDALGRSLATARPPERIVSLVPSLTEALFALGAGDRVAGVTAYCEEPSKRVRLLPRVGGTKNLDPAAIRALRPDLVIASAEENRKEDVDGLIDLGLPVFVTLYKTVREALAGLALLRDLVAPGVQPDWLADATAEIALAESLHPTAVPYFCPIWRHPYMVARDDTYMSDLLRLAGGINAIPSRGPLHYFTVELEELRAARPAIVFLPDEPYPFKARHRAEFASLREVPAVENSRIVLVDGKALTWYGPRMAAALKFFRELFETGAEGERAAQPGRH